MGWVAVTATHVYVNNGYSWDPPSALGHAPLDDDENWTTTDAVPAAMSQTGVNNPAVTYDGKHYILITPQHKGGVWRYVEP